jgi:two-component system, sensor histidine kinase and response regulator
MLLAKQTRSPLELNVDHHLANCRVLIVDHNETSGQFLHEQIVSWNMRSDTVRSGAEALVLCSAAKALDPYTLAMIEMQMPEMDGLALARGIKTDPALARTKLIILVPFGKTLSRDERRDFGIVALCSKPVRQSTLFDCLLSVILKALTSASESRREELSEG